VSRDKPVNVTTVPYLKSVRGGNDLTLDNKHDYYYQVQGQLLCSGRKACQFVVFTHKDMKVCCIERDEQFIHDMLEKTEGVS
jgi:hypothetical protein